MKNLFNKTILIHLAIITILVYICYTGAINSEFLSDDIGIYTGSDRMKSISYIFGEPMGIVKTSINYVVYNIFGSNPAAFRLLNINFHLGSSLLIYGIVLILTGNSIAALFSGILAAIHPMFVESVVWISAGNYVQYSFFFLLSLFTYISAKNKKKGYFLSLLFFLLSIATSEKAVPLSMVFVVYEIAFGNLKKNWKKIIPFFVLTIIFLFLILVVFKYAQMYTTRLTSNYYSDSQAYNPLLQIPTAITTYLELIFWPSNLSFYHSELSMSIWQFFWKVTGLILLLIVYVFSYFKFRQVFLFISIFIISLLVTLTPFKFGWIVAERYAYLGTLAILSGIGYLLSQLTKIKKIRILLFVSFFCITIALITRTIVRTSDWKTADNLWLATGKTAPSDPKTHNNLGDYYGRHGDLNRAEAEFLRAIELQRNYADAYHNLGNTYVQKNEIDKAVASYRNALKYNPNIWQSQQNLASLYFQKGDFEQALSHMQEALKIVPSNPQLYVNYGVILQKIGNNELAKTYFDKAISMDPGLVSTIKKLLKNK